MKFISMMMKTVAFIGLLAGLLLTMTDLDENLDRVAASGSCWLDRFRPLVLQDQEPLSGFLTLAADVSGRSVRIHYAANAPGYVSIWNHSSRGYVKRLVPADPSTDVSSATRSIPIVPGPNNPITGYAELAGEQKVIAIWTREAPAQLREHHFRCKRMFARSLEDLRSRSPSDWAIKTVLLHVH